MSSAGSASRRGGATYAVYPEPQRPKRPSILVAWLVDTLLMVSVFAAILLVLVLQIG